MTKVMKQEIMVAGEKAGISVSDSRWEHFFHNLKESEIFIVSKDNIIVHCSSFSTDDIEFLHMNGKMVQINVSENI